MPLFKISGEQKATRLRVSEFSKERSLQNLFEHNLVELLGVRFVAHEFSTGDRQRGRIDTLGLDQDGSPVIIEYKKHSNENVINQGLFYLVWLVDHKGDFTLAAQKALGKEIVIDWLNPRLILIAESFSKYDTYAINRIGANIELQTYRLYEDGFLYLEANYVAEQGQRGQPADGSVARVQTEAVSAEGIPAETFYIEDLLRGKPESTRQLFEEVREAIFALGEADMILEKANKNIVSYRHGKNFCELWIQNARLKLWIDIPAAQLDDPYGLARDVSRVGHWGTGESEVSLGSLNELDKVMDLVRQAYQLTL